jgi:hypothetical protein
VCLPALAQDSRAAAGLKEALQIGAKNAISLTGRTDGFFKNEAIKILMPKALQTVERGLRMVGMGAQVDGFVLSMNRAAERAVPKAGRIFSDAVSTMTFDGARQILSGGDTAAAEYFRSRTSAQLGEAFLPEIKKATDAAGATKQFKDLMGQAPQLPFGKTASFDLDAYVLDKTLAGLFFVLGEEERKIRKNPAARVTTLLRDVFGKR